LIQLIDKVSAFKRKFLLWKRKINEGGEMNYFPRLQLFITENEIEITANIVSLFERHLHDLSIHFEKYFPENCDRFQWVTNPFSSDAPSEFSTTEEEELIELSSDFTKSKVSIHAIANILVFSKTSFPKLEQQSTEGFNSFCNILSLREWIFSNGCHKNQVQIKTQSGEGNEGSYISITTKI
jgi:hypothetical protein